MNDTSLLNWFLNENGIWIILGTFLTTIVIGILNKLYRIFPALKNRYYLRKGKKTYIANLKQQITTLIAIGRRRGFQLNEVYVDLDLMDLFPATDEHNSQDHLAHTFTLTGGPGAGKSTYAKNMIYKTIQQNNQFAYLLKLRNYVGAHSIEEALIDQLENSGIPDPSKFFKESRTHGKALIVLDGLDEVRPAMLSAVIIRVNEFLEKYRNTAGYTIVVTCRKEPLRQIELLTEQTYEVTPLNNSKIQQFAAKWPLGYPEGKSKETFWRDLSSAEKILELARSPLLLVGGLMQYTESNLGIPDERYEYLARISEWLTTAWTDAQNLPQDPYRHAYKRILMRFAHKMHEAGLSDIAKDEAIRDVRKWLPDIGLNPDDALSVLDSLINRTGIIIHDNPERLLFSQKSLQEYHCSTYLAKRTSIVEVLTRARESIADSTQANWWREPILLCAAQLEDPTSLLEGLYEIDEALATAAVSECPAPSLKMQRRAVNFCIQSVVAGESNALMMSVTLLRKIRGRLEIKFISGLEERLKDDEFDHIVLVGLILASAGTKNATAALALHPEIWNECFEHAGYLSDSFEMLLLDWIRDNDIAKSREAANLLTKNLTADNLIPLLALMKKVSKPRAEFVASAILVHLPQFFSSHRRNIEEKYFQSMPDAVAQLGSNDVEIASVTSGLIEQYNKSPTRNKRVPLSGRPSRYAFNTNINMVMCALHLRIGGSIPKSPVIANFILGSATFSENIGKDLTFLSSMIIAYSYFLVNYSSVTIGFGILLFIIANGLYALQMPWSTQHYMYPNVAYIVRRFLVLVVGFVLALHWGASIDTIPGQGKISWLLPIVPIIIFSLNSRPKIYYPKFHWTHLTKPYQFTWARYIWSAILFIMVVSAFQFDFWPTKVVENILRVAIPVLLIIIIAKVVNYGRMWLKLAGVMKRLIPFP